MRIVAAAISLITFASLQIGCAQNPFWQGSGKGSPEKQVALETRSRELESRATTLDLNNTELHAQLAQSQQQGKLLEDQLAVMRDQLSSVSTQLAQVKGDKERGDKQVEAMAAATKQRGGATIKANSSFQRTLPAVNLPGVQVRQDGDLIRIELPASRLFQPGGVAMQPMSKSLVDGVAQEVARTYPDQLIGVEGHTDAEGARGAAAATAQQVSVARALAVYQYLTASNQVQSTQMFTVGHGGNHPVVSNATPAGRDRNNRVEIVVYPDKRR